eukprot:355191-Chlamydomonas_euryale.AAC.8
MEQLAGRCHTLRQECTNSTSSEGRCLAREARMCGRYPSAGSNLADRAVRYVRVGGVAQVASCSGTCWPFAPGRTATWKRGVMRAAGSYQPQGAVSFRVVRELRAGHVHCRVGLCELLGRMNHRASRAKQAAIVVTGRDWGVAAKGVKHLGAAFLQLKA